jgi:hypothetical protein
MLQFVSQARDMGDLGSAGMCDRGRRGTRAESGDERADALHARGARLQGTSGACGLGTRSSAGTRTSRPWGDTWHGRHGRRSAASHTSSRSRVPGNVLDAGQRVLDCPVFPKIGTERHFFRNRKL